MRSASRGVPAASFRECMTDQAIYYESGRVRLNTNAKLNDRLTTGWRRVAIGAVIVAGVVVIWFALPRWGLSADMFYKAVRSAHGVLVFAAMTILPVFGFSIGIVYVVAGAKFGISLGLINVALATVVHIVASHWIAKSFLRERVEKLLAKRNYHLPNLLEREEASVVLLTALIPGVLYAMRNYLLGLAAVRLRTCLWVCVPVYTI